MMPTDEVFSSLDDPILRASTVNGSSSSIFWPDDIPTPINPVSPIRANFFMFIYCFKTGT